MTPTYDLFLLLDTAAADERRAEILAIVEKLVTSGGTVVGAHQWGVRALTFEIDHREEAEYHLLQFAGPPALLEQLDRTLKITDDVVRFRIIKLAPGAPPPPAQPRSERPAASVAGDAPSSPPDSGAGSSPDTSDQPEASAEAVAQAVPADTPAEVETAVDESPGAESQAPESAPEPTAAA